MPEVRKPPIPAIKVEDSGTKEILVPVKEQLEIITGQRGNEIAALASNAGKTDVLNKLNEIAARLNGSGTATNQSSYIGDTFTNNTLVKAGIRNRVTNSQKWINQLGQASYTTTNIWCNDRTYIFSSGAGVLTLTPSSSFAGGAPPGLRNYNRVTVTTPDTSLAAADRHIIVEYIDWLNLLDLGWGGSSTTAKQLAFRIWVRCSAAGVMACGLLAPSGVITYLFRLTINQANTWEEKTLIIPADPTNNWYTGTVWQLILDMGSGSNFSGTENTFAAGNRNTFAGATNFMATNGLTFDYTGLFMTPTEGGVMPPFDCQDNYYADLEQCRRYRQPLNHYLANSNNRIGVFFSGIIDTPVLFTTPMRTTAALANGSQYNTWQTTTPAANQIAAFHVGDGVWKTASGTITMTLVNPSADHGLIRFGASGGFSGNIGLCLTVAGANPTVFFQAE